MLAGKLKTLVATALVAHHIPLASAHTWLEELQVVGTNGSYVGNSGFSRGYVSRTDPDFAGDSNILWLLPALAARMPDDTVRSRINSSDLLCHPNQRASNYTNPKYPMLKVRPGDYVAMKYLENGHVSLPWQSQGKPEGGGTVLIFGTTEPSPQEKIADVLKWNEQGTGGNKKGFLLSAQNYDDGECRQMNMCYISASRQILSPNDIPGQEGTQAERWCESDVKIPDNQLPGKLTVYWVWQWPTEPGRSCINPDGKDEFYTTCADFEVLNDANTGDKKIVSEPAPPASGLEQQDPNQRAVKNFASRTAAVPSRKLYLDNWANYSPLAKRSASAVPSLAAWSKSCQASIVAEQSARDLNPTSLPPPCPEGSYAPTGAAYTAWSASIKAAGTAVAPGGAPATGVPVATSAPAGPSPSAAAPMKSTPPAPTAAPVAPSQPAPPAAPSASGAPTAPLSYTTVVVTVTTMVSSFAPAPSSPTVVDAPAMAGSNDTYSFPVLSTRAGNDKRAATPVPVRSETGNNEHLEQHKRHARNFRRRA